MESEAIKSLKLNFPQFVESTDSFRGDACAVLKREGAKEIFKFLRDDPALQFNLLMDLTCVDYPEKDRRFEVVYHLYSVPKNHRVRIKVLVGEKDLWVDTVSDLWAIGNWLEREAWDMFGIDFKGHPDKRRILLYEEFEGHPLRKDYPATLEQPRIPMREVDEARFTMPEEIKPVGPEAEQEESETKS
jgi:NADH-quinone oxidoreductase subunit C